MNIVKCPPPVCAGAKERNSLPKTGGFLIGHWDMYSTRGRERYCSPGSGLYLHTLNWLRPGKRSLGDGIYNVDILP